MIQETIQFVVNTKGFLTLKKNCWKIKKKKIVINFEYCNRQELSTNDIVFLN